MHDQANWCDGFQNTGYRRGKEAVGYRDASPFKIKHRPGFLETETHTMQFPSPSSPITAMQKILHCKIFFYSRMHLQFQILEYDNMHTKHPGHAACILCTRCLEKRSLSFFDLKKSPKKV